jgi:hypothetical protein
MIINKSSCKIFIVTLLSELSKSVLKVLINLNTVVSNHFHSVKILLFSSARSHDFDGTPGTELPVSMYTTKTPIDMCRFNVPRKPLNKYWCSVPHYLSNIKNIYIKADRFPLMMPTAANKERKQI